MAVSTVTKAGVNDVDVAQLMETIDHVKQAPEMARFRFRARNQWRGGARSETTIHHFYHAGEENQTRQQPFVLEGDEPPILLGENTAPNAVEAVLHALASCLVVGFIYNAAAQGIEVQELESQIEGELDLHGFLGLSDEIRPGYESINVTYRVQADAPREKLEALCAYVQDTSPVLDMLRNPVPVAVEMQT
jgi:uncharacterized OsmC-like protein